MRPTRRCARAPAARGHATETAPSGDWAAFTRPPAARRPPRGLPSGRAAVAWRRVSRRRSPRAVTVAGWTTPRRKSPWGTPRRKSPAPQEVPLGHWGRPEGQLLEGRLLL